MGLDELDCNMSGFTAEEKQRVIDTYNSALQSASRSFHGESRAAQDVARIHAAITVLFIKSGM